MGGCHDLIRAPDKLIEPFLKKVRMLVLDEAHVYDGVFGTNMAYFLRRFAAVADQARLVCSTATMGRPDDFMEKLTGRKLHVFGSASDTSACPEKTILLCRTASGDPFENAVKLLSELAKLDGSRFLAFGDSRKMVERFVAAVSRFRGDSSATPENTPEDEASDEMDDIPPQERASFENILPYRAGYEAQDRKDIQEALMEGRLAGVVSTSALELGLGHR